VEDPKKNSFWFLKFLVALFALILMLVVIEIVLCLYAPRPFTPTLQEQLDSAEKFNEKMKQQSTVMKVIDPLFHHSTYPNRSQEGQLEGHPYRFTANNEGCRATENYVEEKPKDFYRIALTGDSFTVGLYVDDKETYSYQLQKMLRQSPAEKTWQLYNFGNVSYSPLLYWQQYTHRISRFHPDLFIIAMDNSDIQDDFYYEQDAIFDSQGELQGFKDVHYSFFLGQVRDIGTPEERVITLKKKMASPWQSFLGWCTSHLQMGVYIRDYFERQGFKKGDIFTDRFGHNREGVDWSIHWQRTAKYLDKTVQAAKKDGVPVLILFYPYPHQVNGTDWPYRVSMGYELGKVYDTPMRQWLADFAKKEGVDYLDAFDEFRKSGIHNFSFHDDPHYLPNGHELLAKILFQYLTTHYNQKISMINEKKAILGKDQKGD
jgi:hypothetical protein